MNSNFPDTKNILIAPLDWGLGHATRCIPVIRQLLQAGCKVYICSDGRQASLLKREFPEATHLRLPGYGIRYSSNSLFFGLKMLRQLPKMRSAIKKEHQWLEQTAARYHLDGIISDNRFGLYHIDIPSVIMTHQLYIKAPFTGRPERWLQKANYHFLKKFNTCWVVDFEGTENLAGKLSHPHVAPPLPVKYLGPLSRFQNHNDVKYQYDLAVLISGPEPQRTLFEKRIREQIVPLPIRAIIVTGNPDRPHSEQLSPTIKLVHHLDSIALNETLLQSRMVLARSGYTTIMDLVKLQKQAILVPTPGQTEQEYLGKILMEKGYFFMLPQRHFNLKKALSVAEKYTFQPFPSMNMGQYKSVITDFVNAL